MSDINDLEERVRRLEESRFRIIGELSAQRTLLLSAWMQLIAQSDDPPEEVIEKLRQRWLPPYDEPIAAFRGADLAGVEAASQEHDRRIVDLFGILEQAVLGRNKG